MTADQLLYVGFNSRIAALSRSNGALVWQWEATNGTGFVALLLDGDLLFASVDGYTYCMDAINGQELWCNQLEGFGTGVPCLCTANGSTAHGLLAEADLETRRRRNAGH